jgi:2-keto-4-pentenoate hydratase/2-oxohepta-3-ene-1,7-dioic acid hydratase in catechol pathway
MEKWSRFDHNGDIKFGKLSSDNKTVTVCNGDMFGSSTDTNEVLEVNDVKMLSPCKPSKMIALWNNYKALADEKGLSYPERPLYIFKSPTSFAGPNDHIEHPSNYDGDVFFEGELGIVIGSTVKDLDNTPDAKNAIFGYTCINDVTAFGLLKNDPNFDQWTRCKGFDNFGVFGPCISTGLESKDLKIKTIINDSDIKQDYPVSDMMFTTEEIVMFLSQNMTLYAGDVICVGTSLGLGPMEKGSKVTIEINSIGSLTNTYG